MDLLRGFWTVCVENTQNQTFNDVFEVALHCSALFQQRAFHVIVHIILYTILIDCDRFVVYNFSIINGVKPPQTCSIFSQPSLLNNSFMNPKRHLLLQQVMNYFELVTQLLRTNPIFTVLHLLFIKIVDKDRLNRQTFEVKASIIESKSQIYMSQVVMEEYFTKCFDLGEYFSVLGEN